MILYNIFLVAYSLMIRIVSLGNAKAKLWINGRRNLFQQIESGYNPGNAKKVWMHCASLGEAAFAAAWDAGRALTWRQAADYALFQDVEKG